MEQTTARRIGRTLAALLALMLALALGACGSGDDDGGDGGDAAKSSGKITVWTLEREPDRMAAQERILARFTARTGVRVDLRGIDADQLQTLISSAAAGGTLPDAMFALPLSFASGLAAQRLSDPSVAQQIVDDLDPATFSPRALRLASSEGGVIGVPSGVELRRALRAGGVAHPFAISQANGRRAYLPPAHAFADGGYEVEWALTSGFPPTLQDDIRAAVLAALAERGPTASVSFPAAGISGT